MEEALEAYGAALENAKAGEDTDAVHGMTIMCMCCAACLRSVHADAPVACLLPASPVTNACTRKTMSTVPSLHRQAKVNSGELAGRIAALTRGRVEVRATPADLSS